MYYLQDAVNCSGLDWCTYNCFSWLSIIFRLSNQIEKTKRGEESAFRYTVKTREATFYAFLSCRPRKCNACTRVHCVTCVHLSLSLSLSLYVYLVVRCNSILYFTTHPIDKGTWVGEQCEFTEQTFTRWVCKRSTMTHSALTTTHTHTCTVSDNQVDTVKCPFMDKCRLRALER